MRTTGRAAAHSLQFGTYALWTAGLLAALAVRPAPSCAHSLPRGVNEQVPNDVQPGQTACRCLRSVMDVEARLPAPGRVGRTAQESSPPTIGGMADARSVSLRAGASSSEAAGLRNELHSSRLDRPPADRRVPVENSRCDVTVAAVAADDHAGWIVTLTGQFIASQVPLNHLSTVTTLCDSARSCHLRPASAGPPTTRVVF